MIPFNTKIALRNIWTNKVFSGVNIIGLALSMACCLVISLYIWNERSYDGFHKNLHNIYRITEKQNQAGSLYTVAVTPGPLAPALQKDFPEIANTVRFGNWSGLLKNKDHVYEEKNIQLTDNSIFKVFDFPLVKGNPNTALLSPDQIVITERTADKYFGKDWRTLPNLLGQRFRLNNETDFTLAGIARDLPENSSIRFDVLLPLSFLFTSDKFSYQWNSNNYHTYLQLKPGSNTAAVEKKLATQLHRYNADTQDILMLQPLAQQYLYSTFDFNTDWGKRNNIKYVNIFTAVGLLLLIIACVNFINLSTARSLKRSMEVGVRKVNGATRNQLIQQFLTESVLVSFISGLLAIVIISIVQPWLTGLTGTAINTSFSQSMLLPFFLLFVLLIGLVAGLYPALVLSSFNPVRVMSKNMGHFSGKRFRQALTVGQFAISATLITCTFFMYRQLHFMQQTDLGFNKDQLINFGLGRQLAEKNEAFRHDLERVAGITAVAPATISMVDVDNSSYMEWEGMGKEDKFLITQANIDPAFIPALGMRIVSGTNFSRQFTNDTANYIINESAVKHMGFTNTTVLGRQVNFWGAKGRVIGVVSDFHFKPLRTSIGPFIFRYQPQDRYFSMFIKTAPGKSNEIIKKVEKIYKAYEPESAFKYSFVSDTLNQSYQEEQQTATILLLFANLTIFVGCLGLFGLSVFSAEQRIKEIGIRKVLGAGLRSITGLLSADFLKLVFIAIAMAVPAAWYITGKWLQNYAYRIQMDWWVFALVGCMVIFIALFTISFQAIKAAAANPVKSLRAE